MPETQTLTIEARQTRKGDLVLTAGLWLQATFVETKDKWTYIYEGGKAKPMCKVLKAGEVTVKREVPTYAERVAQAEAYAAEEALRLAQKSYLKAEAAAQALAECKWSSSLYSYMHDHAAAMIERDLWDEALRETGHDDGEGGVVMLVMAVRYVHDKQVKALLDNRYRGSSTSDFSNAVDAVTRETVSGWIRNYVVQSCVRVAEGRCVI